MQIVSVKRIQHNCMAQDIHACKRLHTPKPLNTDSNDEKERIKNARSPPQISIPIYSGARLMLPGPRSGSTGARKGSIARTLLLTFVVLCLSFFFGPPLVPFGPLAIGKNHTGQLLFCFLWLSPSILPSHPRVL